jgi:hypothetical protein
VTRHHRSDDEPEDFEAFLERELADELAAALDDEIASRAFDTWPDKSQQDGEAKDAEKNDAHEHRE